MRCGSLILISILGGTTSMGCSGGDDARAGVGDASAFEGIYQLSAASNNLAGCAAPGASTLSQLKEQFFVITSSEVFGQKIAILNSCSSVANCQAKRDAQQNNEAYSIEYTFTFSSSDNARTLNGFEATTGYSQGTMCIERTYAEHVLTLAANRSVHLESRTTNLADLPQKDGFCWVEPAKSKQEAAGKPCRSLEVLDASFVQAN